MAINVNWNRWIFASISQHFKTKMDASSLAMFIEGQHRDTDTLSDYVELRIDGPDWREYSKDYWVGDVEVNILVSSAMSDSNYHTIHTNVGIVAAAFTPINVFRYGSGGGDDDSGLGCLKIKVDRLRDAIEVNHFGQIDKHTKIIQSTVEAHYQIHLNA
jgi:hypothetical protein